MRRKREVAAAEDDRTAAEQIIRERAYAIWEEEGRPQGRALDNWFQAEAELGDVWVGA